MQHAPLDMRYEMLVYLRLPWQMAHSGLYRCIGSTLIASHTAMRTIAQHLHQRQIGEQAAILF